MTTRSNRSIVPFLAGLGAAVVLHSITGWWLNSGRGVAITLIGLLTMAVLLGRLRSGSRLQQATAMWTGTLVGMTFVLFRVGPGTIWPIVLVVAATLSAAAVFTGVWLGRSRGTSSPRSGSLPR